MRCGGGGWRLRVPCGGGGVDGTEVRQLRLPRANLVKIRAPKPENDEITLPVSSFPCVPLLTLL